jgi:arylsulfatase
LTTDYNNAGQPDSFILYGKHWAQVSSTPYKHYKGNASEGGIRGPMILRMPAYLQNKIPSGRSSALTGIEDIMPTFLELAQINAQELEVKESQVSMTGNSMLLNTAGTVGAASEEFEGIRVIGREIWGKQGLRSENWKLVNQPPPTGSGEWQLYNLKDDLAEQHDLASSNPQKLAEMLNLWQNYVELNNVVLPAGEFRVRDSGPMPVE